MLQTYVGRCEEKLLDAVPVILADRDMECKARQQSSFLDNRLQVAQKKICTAFEKEQCSYELIFFQ